MQTRNSFSKLSLAIIFSFIFVTISVAVPHKAFAQVRAGFVDTTIWFSNEPDVVGETTTISTLINNQDEKAIYGMVGFYDNDKLVGQKATTVEPNASKVVSVTWKVTAGSHSFVAKFENTKRGSESGTATRVTGSQSAPYRFSVAATVDKTTTDKATSPNSTTTDGTTTKTEQAVGDVKNAAESTFEKFDNFRDTTADSIAVKVTASAKAVEEIQKAKTENKTEGKVAGASVSKETSGSAMETPFAYLKLYFYKMAHFIFDHMYVFYGLIILVIILFVRYLIRAPR
jgi:hypothetical protein